MGDRMYTLGERRFFAARRRARSILPAWEGRGNPWRWFSWEVLPDGERDYLACGVDTLREAQRPIDEACGITG